MDRPDDMGPSADAGVALRAIAAMRLRIRALRAARGAIEMGMFGLAFAVLMVLGGKLGSLPEHAARRLAWAAFLFPAIGIAVGWVRRVPALLAAQLLDRAYGLSDRLANALEFGEIPPAARTPMMAAALEDAALQTRKRDLRPSRALEWRWPAESWAFVALLVTLAGVRLMEIRIPIAIFGPAPVMVPQDRLALSDDDIQAFREFSREMDRQATTDATREALRRFDQFVNQLSDEQLNRQDAFRRLQALQDELERGRENDREELRDALREAGNRMDENRTTQQLAEAMRQADPHAAAEAMHQLAEQLRQNRMSQEQRQQLQQALQHAMQQRNQEQLDQQLQRQREEVERMLRQQREHQLSESEQRNLHQRQRDLERLQHDQQRQESQRRQLERLNRAMSQAMQDLSRDMAQAAQDLDHGAEDLNRMSNEQLSDQQISELRQQLEDLRQRMRQQNGQGGQQQRMRLQRFAGQARGGVMPGGMTPGGQRGQLRLGMGGPGQGIPIPMGRAGNQQGQGGGQEGHDPGGIEAGTQHDAHIRGAATSLRGNMQTVNVAGQHRANGPTRSQVIRTAAQDGFTGQGYREVHESYWEHAREVVHAGDVPPGYRSYVRRYFQLIRPRDGE